MVQCSRLTWPFSQPPTLPLFHGIPFNSPICQTVLRRQCQAPTLLDIKLRWLWHKTISISWACLVYRRVVLRFSLFTVCSNSSTISFPFINFKPLFFLYKNIVSFMQPAPQSMGTFPTSHGKTASFFLQSGVQEEYAFIPDDGSATYVVNVAVSHFFKYYLSSLFYLDSKCVS